MTTSRNLAAVLLLPASLALLAGCAAPSAPTTGSDTGTDGGDAAAASGDFCTEFESNGGNGSMLGPVQSWLPKEDLLPDVQSRVDAMGDIEPPADIATEWGVLKTYYTDLLTAVEALPDGGTLTGDAAALGQAPDEYQAVTDYYFATC
jgi:ABC-type transport system substrate-binding protein